MGRDKWRAFTSRTQRLLFILAVLGVQPALRATDYTVTKLTDTKPALGGDGAGTSGDLRYCVTQANFGAGGTSHTITFAVAGGITLAGRELVINTDLTITGPGAANLTVDGNNASRIFYIAPGHTVAISGLKLTRGNGTGNDSTGLDPGNTHGLYYDDCGGLIFNDGGALTLTACTLSDSTTGRGGALYNKAWDADASLSVSGCTFSGNSAKDPNAGGGAIYNWAFGHVATLLLDNSVMSGNSATSGGGAIYNNGETQPTIVTIDSCTISGNTADGSNISGGGGIYSYGIAGSTMDITDSAISQNILTGNPDAGGAGILQLSGRMTLKNCTVSNNTSKTFGGGITNHGGNSIIGNSTLTLIDCAISGNTAGKSGGGIFNFSYQGTANLLAENCTIAANSAGQRGGALYNRTDGYTGDASTAAFRNCTLAGNSALAGGGGIANDKPQSAVDATASVALSNSLLALNPTGANYNAISGAGVSTGFNLCDDLTCAAFLTQPGDLNATPAGLQVDSSGKPIVQNNGGPTWTIALIPTSAAIDAGKSADDPLTSLPATTDQRGIARPFDMQDVADAPGGDGSDIGAFESDGSPLIIPPNPTDNARPTISVSGKKTIITARNTFLVKGTAKGKIAKVTYHVGKGKPRKAAGKNSWRFTASLKPGRNIITIVAESTNGKKATIRIVVIRKKR